MNGIEAQPKGKKSTYQVTFSLFFSCALILHPLLEKTSSTSTSISSQSEKTLSVPTNVGNAPMTRKETSSFFNLLARHNGRILFPLTMASSQDQTNDEPKQIQEETVLEVEIIKARRELVELEEESEKLQSRLLDLQEQYHKKAFLHKQLQFYDQLLDNFHQYATAYAISSLSQTSSFQPSTNSSKSIPSPKETEQ